MKRIKLFEDFETEKSYAEEAKKLLNTIESMTGVEIPTDIYNEIVNYGEISREELRDCLDKISKLNLKEETIMMVILNVLYPEVREEEGLKNLYWQNVANWHNKIKASPEESEEYQSTLRKIKEIIINSNLRNIVINSPEHEHKITARKYNL